MSATRYSILLVAIAAGACVLVSDADAGTSNCGLTGYTPHVQTFLFPVDIPDADPAGITVGPILTTADGTRFTDVIVDLKIDHTWVGDLIADVTYDVDCDGITEKTARVLCRTGGVGAGGCPGTINTTGCNNDLSCNNTYFFSDAALAEPGEPPACNQATGAVIASGCYLPSRLAMMPLSAFDGLAKGGCFKLYLSDNAGLDVGTLCEWSVHTQSMGMTATRKTSWGGLKVIHR